MTRPAERARSNLCLPYLPFPDRICAVDTKAHGPQPRVTMGSAAQTHTGNQEVAWIRAHHWGTNNYSLSVAQNVMQNWKGTQRFAGFFTDGTSRHALLRNVIMPMKMQGEEAKKRSLKFSFDGRQKKIVLKNFPLLWEVGMNSHLLHSWGGIRIWLLAG